MRGTTVLILATIVAATVAVVAAAGPTWVALVAVWVVALVVGGFAAASEGRRRAVPIPVRIDRRH